MTLNTFEFVVVASLRVRQLVDGCTPRVAWDGKNTAIARREVLAGKVDKIAAPAAGEIGDGVSRGRR
jgi:DNA-directed RNA polymerase subunit K/omega